METIHLGNVGVDSGILRIIDPCYRTREAPDPDERPDFYISGYSYALATEPLGIQLGLDVTGWGGDGYFPVYAEVNEEDGLVKSVTIRFDEEA